MSRNTDVVSHWHLLMDDCSISSQEFYTIVKERLSARRVPETTNDDVEWREGGLASAHRQYLRIRRDRHIFDLCAAPFGSSFFFSWWLVEESVGIPPVLAIAILVGILFALVVCIAKLGLLLGPFAFLIVLVGALLLIRQSGSAGDRAVENVVLSVPILGSVYGLLFKPVTYYAIDTRLAFQESVHRAVVESIDNFRAVHGLRSLTPDEARLSTQSVVRS